MTNPYMHPLAIFQRAKPYKNGAHDWTRRRIEIPLWIKPGKAFLCPACQQRFDYNGPFNPLRFLCPHCQQWLTWQETEQLEPYEVRTCQKCNGDMVQRSGKYGEFCGCEFYPKCKSTKYKTEFRLRRQCKVVTFGTQTA